MDNVCTPLAFPLGPSSTPIAFVKSWLFPTLPILRRNSIALFSLAAITQQIEVLGACGETNESAAMIPSDRMKTIGRFMSSSSSGWMQRALASMIIIIHSCKDVSSIRIRVTGFHLEWQQLLRPWKSLESNEVQEVVIHCKAYLLIQ